MSRRSPFLLVLTFAAVASEAPTFAKDVSWTNTASGLFSNPKNWSAGPSSANRVPNANDDVSFLWPDITATADGAPATRDLTVSVPLTLEIDGS